MNLNDLKIKDENYVANQIFKYYNIYYSYLYEKKDDYFIANLIFKYYNIYYSNMYNNDKLDEWFDHIKTKINWMKCDEKKLDHSKAKEKLILRDYSIDNNKRNTLYHDDKEPDVFNSPLYSKEICDNGLFYSYNSEDKNIVFLLNNKTYCGVSNILKYRNNYLAQLVDDKTTIDLSEYINHINGFQQLMKLYGFGKIELNSENVLEMMCVCVELKDTSFNSSFKEYFSDSSRITNDLLNQYLLQHTYYIENCKDIEDIIKEYIKTNIMKITKKENIIKLSPECLKEVLSFTELVVPNEQDLAANFIKYTNYNYEKEKSIYLFLYIYNSK